MKRFKLIKEYPGSPKLGTEVTRALRHQHYNFNGGTFKDALSIMSVEENPEFWIEVKPPLAKSEDGVDIYEEQRVFWVIMTDLGPKLHVEGNFTRCHIVLGVPKYYKFFSSKKAAEEYVEDYNKPKFQILGFTDGFNHYFKLSNNNFTINTAYEYNIQKLIDRKDCKVTKIKRESDGEIFMIGDKLEIGLLSEIHIGEPCLIETEEGSTQPLEHVVKLKPVFTTYDFVDIFAGDNYFVLDPDSLCLGAGAIKATKYSNDGRNTLLRFSSSEAAKEYARENFVLGQTQCGGKIMYGDELFCVKEWKIKSVWDCAFTEDNVKYFKTQEEAKEYVILNKPCLSINDVASVYVTANRKSNNPRFAIQGWCKQAGQLRRLAIRKLKK